MTCSRSSWTGTGTIDGRRLLGVDADAAGVGRSTIDSAGHAAWEVECLDGPDCHPERAESAGVGAGGHVPVWGAASAQTAGEFLPPAVADSAVVHRRRADYMRSITRRRSKLLAGALAIATLIGVSDSAEARQATRPKAPTEVRAAAVAKTNTATITWSKPASNGGARVRRYNVRCASPVGVTRRVTTRKTRATVAGLSWHKPYVCFVKAVNRKGSSKAARSNGFMVPMKPEAPKPTGTVAVDCGFGLRGELKGFPAGESHTTFVVLFNETDQDFRTLQEPFKGSWSGRIAWPQNWSGHGPVKIHGQVGYDGPGHTVADVDVTCN
jgi:hypothetical protein